MSTISAGTTTPTALSLSGDTTGALTFQVNGTTTAATISSAGNVSLATGNLTFSGTAQRITGDFSNATVASRLFFQNSTTNAITRVGAIPNGTATESGYNFYNTSAVTTGEFGQLYITSSEVTLRSAVLAGGSFLPMTFYTGGSERMRLDTSGNLGIGTASPVVQVHATGVGRFSQLQMPNNAGTYTSGSAGFHLFGFSDNNLYFNWFDAGAIVFRNNGTSERMRIDSSGNVGIGTTNPAGYKLRIAGTSGAAQFRAGTDANGYFEINAFDSNPVYCVVAGANATAGVFGTQSNIPTIFFSNNTERMRITSAGEVNIGSSANYGGLLSVNRAQSGGIADLLTLRDSSAGATINFQTYGDPTFGTASRFSYGGAYLAFRAATTEQMRLTSGGNLLIGTTTNLGSNTKVSVAYGGGGSEYGIELKPNANNTVSLSFRNAAGSLVGSVSQDASNTAYNTSSDRRLKENIAPADDAGTLVDAIQIVKHDWKVGGHNRYGVIAQDLYEIVPEAVAKGDEGDEIEKTWGVDYSKLVPILVKEVQSLRARVAELESK